MEEAKALDRRSILDGVAENWSARDIRDFSNVLLRLADSLDQEWDGSNIKGGSIFSWPNQLARIERNALNLAMKARLIYDQRRARREFIPSQFLSEPGWDMLLELFMQYAGGAKVSVTSLCIAADCPASTALRYIAQLEEDGLVCRSASQVDKRVSFIEMTDQGVRALGSYLEQY